MKRKQIDPKLLQQCNALLMAQDIEFAMQRLREFFRVANEVRHIVNRVLEDCKEIAAIIKTDNITDNSQNDGEVQP